MSGSSRRDAPGAAAERGTHEVAQAAEVVVREGEDDAKLHNGVERRVLLQQPQLLGQRRRDEAADRQRREAARHDAASACGLMCVRGDTAARERDVGVGRQAEGGSDADGGQRARARATHRER